MTAPLLSIVIPTHNRPGFLHRAVSSALKSSPETIEVIVVPNGGDETWIQSLNEWRDDRRVIVSPITEPNGNAARNHGMSLARGQYLRFLDDDDFFYPDAAKRQLIELMSLGADLSFGGIALVDADGRFSRMAWQLRTDDFTEAALAPAHSTATGAVVFSRGIAAGLVWDPVVRKNQDVFWAWSLCGSREINSIQFHEAVAAWVQHSFGERVSQGHNRGLVSKKSALRLMELLEQLQKRGTLNQQRTQAAAMFLWECIHSGIMFEPLYWIRMGTIARRLSPEIRPRNKLYSLSLVRRLNPILVEFILIPWRWVKFILGDKFQT